METKTDNPKRTPEEIIKAMEDREGRSVNEIMKDIHDWCDSND